MGLRRVARECALQMLYQLDVGKNSKDEILRTYWQMNEHPPKVREFVLGREETTEFLRGWFGLLSVLMPGYQAEGKTHLAVMMGCTGGMHRSVVLADETADYLRRQGYEVTVSHRDIGKDIERR